MMTIERSSLGKYNITKRAMNVTLSMGLGPQRKKDKEMTRETAYHAGVKEDMVSSSKRLFLKEMLKPFQDIASTARTFHDSRVKPWGVDGSGIIENEKILDYRNGMSVFMNEMENLKSQLEWDYESLKNQMRHELNGSYREADYPPIQKFLKKFYIRILVQPIPDIDDFRTDLSGEAYEYVVKEMEESRKWQEYCAIEPVVEKVREKVERIKDRMETYCGKREGNFHKELFENFEELVDMIPTLNFTNNEKLNKLADDLQGIFRHSPEALRDKKTGEAARQETLAETEAILKKMEAYGF